MMANLAISQTVSPELVSSAGESFSNSNYQLDWSVGETVTATHSAGDFVLTQGFHQDTYIITAIKDLATDINISVYPNPTSNFVIIDFSAPQKLENFKIIVTDINGKILEQAETTAYKKQLDFSDYADGIYYLSVEQKNNQLLKVFKIIKN